MGKVANELLHVLGGPVFSLLGGQDPKHNLFLGLGGNAVATAAEGGSGKDVLMNLTDNTLRNAGGFAAQHGLDPVVAKALGLSAPGSSPAASSPATTASTGAPAGGPGPASGIPGGLNISGSTAPQIAPWVKPNGTP